jgi:hypothetical protein
MSAAFNGGDKVGALGVTHILRVSVEGRSIRTLRRACLRCRTFRASTKDWEPYVMPLAGECNKIAVTSHGVATLVVQLTPRRNIRTASSGRSSYAGTGAGLPRRKPLSCLGRRGQAPADKLKQRRPVSAIRAQASEA